MSWPKAFDQRGKGTLGCLLSLVLLALIGYAAYQVVPVYYRANEFQSAVEREVDRAGARNGDPTMLRKSLMNLAAFSQIPLEPKNLEINKTSTQLVVAIRYSVPVRFWGKTYNLPFNFKLTSIVGSL